MKIMRCREMVFGDLFPGDVFEFADRPNELFMKIENIDEWVDESESRTINAISLDYGEMCNECPIESSRPVKKIDCELRVQ